MVSRLETVAEPCIWMSAGVLTYKLCDRGFDCENCPLYAAIHGTPLVGDEHARPHSVLERPLDVPFPADRLYSDGHTWLMRQGPSDERVQLGLNSFVAGLIPCPRHVRWADGPGVLNRGGMICALEFDDGYLAVVAPVAARLRERNRVLDDDPGLAVADPYRRGWIAILAPLGAGELAGLHTAEFAQEQARLDLRRLRRGIGLRLLAHEHDGTLCRARPGESYADPCHALGGVDYLEVIRELVH